MVKIEHKSMFHYPDITQKLIKMYARVKNNDNIKNLHSKDNLQNRSRLSVA